MTVKRIFATRQEFLQAKSEEKRVQQERDRQANIRFYIEALSRELAEEINPERAYLDKLNKESVAQIYEQKLARLELGLNME